MINAVYFDLGNVILPVDGHRLANKLARHSPQTPNKILEAFWSNEITDQFERGEITPPDFFDYIARTCEISGLPFDQFIHLFNDIFNEDKDVIQLLSSIKSKFKMGLISNTNPIHAPHLLKTFPFFSVFDGLWLSNEVGVRKPDPSIYRMALDRFGVQPSQAVFIDDLTPNVDAAGQIGMHGILYKNFDQLVNELKKLGVLN